MLIKDTLLTKFTHTHTHTHTHKDAEFERFGFLELCNWPDYWLPKLYQSLTLQFRYLAYFNNCGRLTIWNVLYVQYFSYETILPKHTDSLRNIAGDRRREAKGKRSWKENFWVWCFITCSLHQKLLHYRDFFVVVKWGMRRK